MITIKVFVFNPFQVNTYLLYDKSGDCILIDPGCYDDNERQHLLKFISGNDLKPVRVINTHVHTDHILGNAFVCKHFKLGWETHAESRLLWELSSEFSSALNIQLDDIETPTANFQEGDKLRFGKSELEVIYTPGHANGSCCFVNHDQKFIISGDVLFRESIGRTDLPTGDYNILKESIEKKLFTLGYDYTVYPGHGPETTIGHEIEYNPFLDL
jgi:glyoxylase-like metal-dependent hydrolase (beta-lactamase superfamily II)